MAERQPARPGLNPEVITEIRETIRVLAPVDTVSLPVAVEAETGRTAASATSSAIAKGTSSAATATSPKSRCYDGGQRSAEAALYIVCMVLTRLGYFLGLKKCVLMPVQRLLYLGMLIESTVQAFLIQKEKIKTFASLRESILDHKSSISLKSVQKMM
jgi:hypothetical protein